jgi:hypothetical protein
LLSRQLFDFRASLADPRDCVILCLPAASQSEHCN